MDQRLSGWRGGILAILLAATATAGGAGAQDYLASVEARAQEAVARLADAFAGGRVPGRFVERVPGSYVFAPDDVSLPIATVVNAHRVAPLAVGPLLEVAGRLDPDARTVEIEDYALAYARSGEPDEALSRAAEDRAYLTDALAAAAAIVGRLDRAAQPGAQSVVTRALDRSTELGRTTLDDTFKLADAYRAAVDAGDQAAVDAIVERWANVREQIVTALPDGTEYKALYGDPDNYPPWRYDRVSRDAAAVVAIGDPDPGSNRARCSGVLVAEDLVLTAAHCFANQPQKQPSQLAVWFDFAEREDGSRGAPIRRKIVEAVAPPAAKWPDLMAHRFGAELYDYAIVRFSAPPGQSLIPNGAEPQCLRGTPPQRVDPLYVIGYPRGEPVTVHDSGRVELPYEILDGPEFQRLRLDVDADFMEEPDRAEVLRQFDESYVLDTSGVLDVRRLFDIRDGGQPRMGIVADTFRGNSGGPVFDHERGQCVVGILNRGMGDTGVKLTANWKVHERVLPVAAIIEDLRKHAETASLLEEGRLVITE
jgi:hypothetical protein